MMIDANTHTPCLGVNPLVTGRQNHVWMRRA